MADRATDPHDDKVRSVTLPTETDGEHVVAQENQSPEVALGGGEWPSPHAPPQGPAPGAAGEDDDGPERPPGQPTAGPPPGTASAPGLQQDGRTAGDRGPTRLGDVEPTAGEDPGRFPPLKDVLDADPVSAGSQATPSGDGDDQVDGTTKYA